MTDMQLHRDLGRLEAEVATLKSQVAQTNALVAEMHETITAAKGSWKTLLMVAGLSSALTGVVMKAVALLHRWSP